MKLKMHATPETINGTEYPYTSPIGPNINAPIAELTVITNAIAAEVPPILFVSNSLEIPTEKTTITIESPIS